jgi:hypothetical protein
MSRELQVPRSDSGVCSFGRIAGNIGMGAPIGIGTKYPLPRLANPVSLAANASLANVRKQPQEELTQLAFVVEHLLCLPRLLMHYWTEYDK